MSEVRELSPGLYLIEGKLFLCPACGLHRWGRDPMNRRDVFCWLLATLGVLQEAGVQGADPARAGQMADEWVGGAWRMHKEGGHDAGAN